MYQGYDSLKVRDCQKHNVYNVVLCINEFGLDPSKWMNKLFIKPCVCMVLYLHTSWGMEWNLFIGLLGPSDNIDGLVQEKRNSNALAMKLRLSCTNPLACWDQYYKSDMALTAIKLLTNGSTVFKWKLCCHWLWSLWDSFHHAISWKNVKERKKCIE